MAKPAAACHAVLAILAVVDTAIPDRVEVRDTAGILEGDTTTQPTLAQAGLPKARAAAKRSFS